MPTVNRRQLLRGVGAATGSTMLAGCGGDDSDNPDDTTTTNEGPSDTELGERVPTLMYKYYPWNGGHEAIAPVVKQEIEKMGFQVEVSSLEPLTWVDKVYNDSRELHFGDWGTTASGDRLDPQEFIMDYAADNAGPGGTADTHWVNCDYTELAHQQAREPDTEERRELVYQAQEIFGQDYVVWPCITVYREGVARKDQITLNAVGKGGLQVGNYRVQIYSSTDKEAINVGLASNVANTLNWPTQSSGVGQVLWNHIPNSALFEYDENYELQHVLAESSNYDESGETLTVELREGTFHNGDPITAEDVKFTFEHIDENPDMYPIRKDQRFESINAIDDRTVEFNFDGPNPVFRGRYATLIGILHKETWESMGADDNPENFNMTPDSFVGSGPFTVAAWDQGRQVTLAPHDDHPYHSTPEHRLNWVYYEEAQPRISAFQEGTVDLIMTIAQSFVRELKATMSDENLQVEKVDSFAADHLNPQHTLHPTQFKEFRNAIGTGLNRQLINQVETDGKASPQLACSLFTETHPWRAPDEYQTFYTQDPTGEKGRAEQILLDAGWGKDDDGYWHYPADKDLSPPWPQGEQPTGDQFPCLDDEGNYAG